MSQESLCEFPVVFNKVVKTNNKFVSEMNRYDLS